MMNKKCRIDFNRKERIAVMIKARVLWVGIIMLLLLRTGIAQSPDSTLMLSGLIQEALANNPNLQSAENSWQASLAQIPQAGALPDPVLSVNLMNLPVSSFAFDQEPMTGKQIGIMQMFPFPGKQGLKEDIAREGAAVSEARYRELRNQLVKNVKSAYYDLFLVDKSLETVHKNIGVLQEFVRIAETKYSVGGGLQQDVLRAQVELSKLTDRRINLQKQRESVEARLNALLNRPVATPAGQPETVVFTPFLFSLDSLKSLAEHNRPLLQAWEATIRQRDEQVNLARKAYLPDFSLGVAYTQRDVLQNGMGGGDFLSGMLSVKVPLYFRRKQRRQVEESRYQQISAQQQYREMLNRVYADIDASLAGVQNNERLIDLYQSGIIPQAGQALNSAIAGYQTDKVDFLTLLTNQMNLFNFELDYYRILSEQRKGAAELEALTGTELGY